MTNTLNRRLDELERRLGGPEPLFYIFRDRDQEGMYFCFAQERDEPEQHLTEAELAALPGRLVYMALAVEVWRAL